MARINQVLVTVDVVDIDVIVVVIPVGRPRVGVLEIIPAVIKAAIVAAPHVELMLAPETGAKLLVRHTPAAATLVTITAVVSVAAVVVLFGLLRTLLVLRTILLLRGPGLVIAVVLVLLLGAIALRIAVILLRPVILLRSIILLGAVLLRAIVLPRLVVLPRSIILLASTIILLRGLRAILLSVRLLFGAVRRLVLAASVGLLSLFWLFLAFRFLLRFIFIGFLPRVARGADKEHHHRCTKDEFHFDSSDFCSRILSR
jgi:hypothetical protein